MKLIPQLLTWMALLTASGNAFAPTATTGRRTGTTVVVVSMGLFDGIMDFFSEEAKAKREEEKQRILEEQEEAYREVLERRRNPEKMDQYMAERKERLNKFNPNSKEE